MLCENTPLDPASAVSLNKIFLFAHEMPFFTRLRVGLGDSDENDHSGFPYEAYFYESGKSNKYSIRRATWSIGFLLL